MTRRIVEEKKLSKEFGGKPGEKIWPRGDQILPLTDFSVGQKSQNLRPLIVQAVLCRRG